MPDAGTTVPDVAAPGITGSSGGSTDAAESELAGQIDALLSNMGDSAAGLAGDPRSRRESIAGAEATPGAPLDAAARPHGEADRPAAHESASAPLNPSEVESLSAQIEALVDEVAAARKGAPRERAAGEGTDRDVDAGGRQDAASAGIENGPARAAPAEAGEPATPGASDESTARAMVPGETEATPQVATDGPDVEMRELDAHLAARASGAVEPAAPAPPTPVASELPAPRTMDAPVGTAVGAIAASVPPQATAGAAVEPHAPAIAAPASGAAQTPRPSSVVRSATGSLGPAAARLLALSARMLERSPKVARDTAGWIGLVTVFFACCMWAIVLFFRSTPVPEVYAAPSAVLEPGEPTPQGRPRPRAAHAEEPDKAEDSHGADHGATDDHGGGDHGGH